MITIPEDIAKKYEIHNFRHAAEILGTSCESDFIEILNALRAFQITTADIMASGGNESNIPKIVSRLMRPAGWFEARIHGDLLVTVTTHGESVEKKMINIENFMDGHKVDYVKNEVAFDLEWNSKDQTFDRDLYAFRAFYDAGVISAAVLLTRSESLNAVFRALGIMNKYGASTTWMGKLLYRLKASRNGGCPVLVFGITPNVIEDWPHEEN
ncbi:MAG: BglII/BstYI family type II restriction endonuclease [Acidithiobacillus sp.]